VRHDHRRAGRGVLGDLRLGPALVVALIGVPTVLYTVLGGVQAVTWADVKQMVVIVGSLFAIVVVLLVRMPVPPDDALRIAGATGRLRRCSTSRSI
jgi:Na+/proline symporter